MYSLLLKSNLCYYYYLIEHLSFIFVFYSESLIFKHNKQMNRCYDKLDLKTGTYSLVCIFNY